MTDHKTTLKATQDAVAKVTEAAQAAAAKLGETCEILIRPEGPSALVAFHGNATRAAEHLDYLDGELASLETSTKEARKAIAGVEGDANALRKMLDKLYRGVRADSNGPMFANVDLGKPLVQKVAQAAAEAGHPVPTVPPQKPKVPWQKLRVWRDGAWNPTSPGGVEVHGNERFEAINDALLDDVPPEGLLLVPPWLVRDNAVLLPSGEPLAPDLVLLVDDVLHHREDVDIDDTGLGAAMGGEDTEHVGWPPAPEGRILEQRRARGERLTVEDLAHLDGIPAAWLTRTEAYDGWTYYTLDRHLPPVPQAPADPVREAEGRAFDAALAATQTSDDPDLAVACPLSGCERPAGEGCVNYKGKHCAVHADRRKAAQKARGGEKGAKPKKQKKGA